MNNKNYKFEKMITLSLMKGNRDCIVKWCRYKGRTCACGMCDKHISKYPKLHAYVHRKYVKVTFMDVTK